MTLPKRRASKACVVRRGETASRRRNDAPQPRRPSSDGLSPATFSLERAKGARPHPSPFPGAGARARFRSRPSGLHRDWNVDSVPCGQRLSARRLAWAATFPYRAPRRGERESGPPLLVDPRSGPRSPRAGAAPKSASSSARLSAPGARASTASAAAKSPNSTSTTARLLRLFAVEGCSGPSAFSQIASARSSSGRAPAKSRWA